MPGVTHIIRALHHIPAGDIWTAADVAKRKIEVEFFPATQGTGTDRRAGTF